MKRSFRIVFALTLLLSASVAHAQRTCESEYEDALESVTDASLSQGNAQKVTTKIRNAWRMYSSALQNGKTNALNQLRIADQLIDGASMKAVSAEVKERLHASIESFRACLQNAPPVPTTSLTVKVLAIPVEGAGEVPQPVGANAIVTVAGVTGKTKGDSTVTLMVPTGMYSVQARLGTAAGYTQVVLEAGLSTQAEVVMVPSRNTAVPALVTAPEIVDGVLPRDFATLALRLENTIGEAIPVQLINSVEIQSASEIRVITPMFKVGASGEIALADRAAFAAFVLDRVDPFELRIRAVDKQANAYESSLLFAIGRHRPTVAITGASPAGVALKIQHERTGFFFWAATDSSGGLGYPLLPDGPYLIEGETVQGGQRLYARGGFVLDSDKSFQASFFAIDTPSSSAATRAQVVASGDRTSTAPIDKRERKWFRIEADGRVVPDDAPRQTFPSVAIDIETDRDSGTFEARFVDVIDWPQPLEGSTEEELTKVEAESATGIYGSHDDRPVTVRALGADGHVIYRRVLFVPTRFSEGGLREPGRPEPHPEEIEAERARLANGALRTISFRVRLPLDSVDSVEIRGWRPEQFVSWQIEELRSDPSLSQIEDLRGDQ